MISDCVRSHIAWITLNARECGGEVWSEGSTRWAWVPGERTVHGLFPVGPDPHEVASAMERADTLGATATALWSAVDRRRRWLGELGFERGWQPWWMEAEARDAAAGQPGIRTGLCDRAREHDAFRAALVGRADVLLAEATEDGRYAGRAWMHLDGEIAGLYDMAVWPDFRRRGLGRELLAVLSAEAIRRGVRRITLNATPEGAELYRTRGFRMLGAGRTWWRHRRDRT